MPGLASNTRAGLVQGNPVGAGNVSVNPDDGRMAVNGWAELITRILNSESVIGLNSQGQPTTPPAGMRLDIQNLQNNKVDRINRTPENNLVTVNVNEQGQVTGGATTQASNTISDFNSAADSRVAAGITAGIQVTPVFGAIRQMVRDEIRIMTAAPFLNLPSSQVSHGATNAQVLLNQNWNPSSMPGSVNDTLFNTVFKPNTETLIFGGSARLGPVSAPTTSSCRVIIGPRCGGIVMTTTGRWGTFANGSIINRQLRIFIPNLSVHIINIIGWNMANIGESHVLASGDCAWV